MNNLMVMMRITMTNDAMKVLISFNIKHFIEDNR